MSEVQVIRKDGIPAFYVVPAALWEAVKDAIEDAEDAAAYAEAVKNDDGARYPAAVARALCEGATAVRAFREHRAMTLQALADAAGISKPYVSQIESGKRRGTANTLKKIAAVLDVPLSALTP